MWNRISACVVTYALSAGVAAASIIGPTVVKGTSAKEAATTDPRIQCRAVLLSHGQVEYQLTLKDALLDADWVTLQLRDGTDHVYLVARLEGVPIKDGIARRYTVTVDRLALKNSYLQVAASTSKENLWVLLDSVDIYDDWTHATDLIGVSEERLLGTFGTPDDDSRSAKGPRGSGPYELRWRYGEGQDIIVTMQDDQVIKVDHWRNRRPESDRP